MPTYNANTPQPTDTISSTQLPIQTNFASIQTTFDVNHEDFASPDYGKHKFVEMPNQSADPAGATNEMTLYSKVYAKTAQSEAYVKRDAAANPVPFTAGLINSANGWAFLPCGLLIKWGAANYNVGNNTTQSLNIVFPASVSIPVFTNIWNVQTQVQNSGALPGVSLNAYVRNVLTTDITVEVGNSNASSQTGIIYYFVIGTGTP